MKLYLGIDLGTSGVRTSVIDSDGKLLSDAAVGVEAPILVDDRPCQDANLWWAAVEQCLVAQRIDLKKNGHSLDNVDALSVDGTSGTLLLTDGDLNPLTRGYMYNSGGFDRAAETVARFAPDESLARGSGSGLARLLFLQEQAGSDAAFALHQADWIAAKLMRHGGLSDETNVLKMGYDVQKRCWPDWFVSCGVNTDSLPEVKPVGDSFGVIDDAIAAHFGFAKHTRVVAGATDSNAAFLASGATEIGDAVTSLGTTLAIKLLSDKPVSDPSRGIYSHRIGDKWLPGGASNSGGGVLLDHFTTDQIRDLSQSVDPSAPTGLDYYPLSRPGERFPISDPKFPGRLAPRPESDAVFFQAILEGISEIERTGYEALADLGAPKLNRVFTAGGGAKNASWTQIRQQKLGVAVVDSQSGEASVGAARIAAGLI